MSRSVLHRGLPGHIAKTRGLPWAQAATHVIRKVLLRQLAILNYIDPF